MSDLVTEVTWKIALPLFFCLWNPTACTRCVNKMTDRAGRTLNTLVNSDDVNKFIAIALQCLQLIFPGKN